MSEYSPFDIDEQEREKHDREVRSKLERDTEEADIRWLMSSKRGRRIVWRLLSQAGVFQPVFHPTAMMMAFKEGHRNYGLQMLNAVTAFCPDLYATMQKENTHVGSDTSRSDRPNQ